MADHSQRKPLLLSIDDEDGMRAVIAGVAEQAGFEAIGACGKADILAALARDPDVVVLDVSMPDMDGVEVVWELGRQHSRAALIILSGFDLATLKAAATIARKSELDIRACLSKPVEIAELRQLLIELRERPAA